ncbi:hypothetical protein JXM67_08175 [candidate division WOR-3 bacterium]|nr:hypothetical protein [candidate division WOR-3 bacterium]
MLSRKSLVLTFLLLILVHAACVDPLSREEYRECREAILEGQYKEDFFYQLAAEFAPDFWFLKKKERKLPNLSAHGNYAVVCDAVYESGSLGVAVGTWFGSDGVRTRRRMKRGARMACRSLGYSYTDFNKAHELYGILKQTYTSEVRETKRFSRRKVSDFIFDEKLPSFYYDHLMIDLLLTNEHLVSVEEDGKVLFDGSEITAAEYKLFFVNNNIVLTFSKNATYADVIPVVTAWRDLGNNVIVVETVNQFSDIITGFCIVPGELKDITPSLKSRQYGYLDFPYWLSDIDTDPETRLKSTGWLAVWITPDGHIVTPERDTTTLDEFDDYLSSKREKGDEIPALVLCADGVRFDYITQRSTQRNAVFYLCPLDEFGYYVQRSERIDREKRYSIEDGR